MNRFNSKNVMALGLVCLLLGAGCAKQPVAESMPAADQSGTTAQTDPIAVIQETAASEQPDVVEATPLVVELETIHFAFDRHSLTAESREILAQNALLLQTNPGLKVTIEGHCDERGSDEYNLALGERRATAARDYLVSLGVASDRVTSVSYGEEQPLDPSGSESAWAKNRRAAFQVTD